MKTFCFFFNLNCKWQFQLSELDLLSVDIDECAEADQGGCETKCSNYEGGYYCTCDVGYRLRDDGKTCEGKHELCFTEL